MTKKYKYLYVNIRQSINSKQKIANFLLEFSMGAVLLPLVINISYANNLDSLTNNDTINAATDKTITNSTLDTSALFDKAQNLEEGSYLTLPLQTVVDPTTGIAIDNAYTINVPERISLEQAQQVLTQVSPKLASNNAAIAANQLQAEATQGLNQPWVFLRSSASYYHIDANIDVDDLKSGLQNGLNDALAKNSSGLPINPNIISNIAPNISNTIPDNYEVEQENHSTSAGVAVLWPIYTGGRTTAITNFTDARTEESQADALLDNDTLQTTLIERYFTAQLATFAAYLRDDALKTIQETDHMAQRYLEEGFISEIERLEAKKALAEAQSESIKAHNNEKLAMTALQRLLRTPQQIKPTTPLFVSSQPLPELQYFQNLALNNHPALKKVDAKYAQAQSLNNLSHANNRPTVSVFGYHEIDNDPSWIAGISASWKLWGGLNSAAQDASGQAKMRQALLAKVDVSDNILLLVEKNWQEVENARVHFLALESNVQLAKEVLRFKKLGMQEGVNTALDVATAQTKYLQAQTEHLQAANNYVQALAALMQSCGTPNAFNDYMVAADIKLPSLYKNN